MNIFRLLTTGLFIGALTLMPVASTAQTNGRRPGAAQNGNNNNKNNNVSRPAAPATTTRPAAPATTSRPTTTTRPAAPVSPSRPATTTRPAAPASPSRPATATRPSAPARPAAPSRPVTAVRPSAPSVPSRPAVRPYLPVRPYSSWTNRPVPPASYRPAYRITPLQSIIGVALGTTLNVTLNTLRSGNYAIQGYNDNCLYLSNVNAMGYNWPDAVLYYSGGALANSTFTYATNSYNATRYNALFASLSNQYGAPVSYNRGNNAISATWWGYNNQYVTLELYQGICQDGYSRYITSLRIGE